MHIASRYATLGVLAPRVVETMSAWALGFLPPRPRRRHRRAPDSCAATMIRDFSCTSIRSKYSRVRASAKQRRKSLVLLRAALIFPGLESIAHLRRPSRFAAGRWRHSPGRNRFVDRIGVLKHTIAIR